MSALNLAVRAWRRSCGLSVPVIERLPDRRGVALTIDDGPSDVATPGILAALRRHDAKAAFFLSGARAEAAPGLVAEIAAEGHQVFSHGYAHVRFDRLDAPAIGDDAAHAEAVLGRFRPPPSPYPIRLPFGEGWRNPAVHRALASWRPDMRIVHWTRHASDWEIAARCASEDDISAQCSTAAEALTATGKLAGAILLLHDEPIDATHRLSGPVAVAFVEYVLAALEKKGTRCVPLAMD